MAKYNLVISHPLDGSETVVEVNSIAEAKAELRAYARDSGIGTGLIAGTEDQYGPTALLQPLAWEPTGYAANDSSHELKFGPRGGLSVERI